MSSFFEKLIANEGKTAASETADSATPETKKPAKKPAKPKAVKSNMEEEIEFLPPKEEPAETKEPIRQPAEPKVKPVEKTKENDKTKLTIENLSPEPDKKPASAEKTFLPKNDRAESPEGKLAVDVFQTADEIVVQAAIAGVRPEDLEITIENGMVKISGHREKSETIAKDDYLIQECHWGAFSRQFVLPSEADTGRSQATFKEGVLTIRIPRIQKERVTKLQVK